MKIFTLFLLLGFSLPVFSATDPFDTSGPITKGASSSNADIQELRKQLQYLKDEILTRGAVEEKVQSGAPESADEGDYKQVASFIEAAGKFYFRLPSVGSGGPRYVEVSEQDYLSAIKHQNAIKNNKNEVDQ